MFNKFLEKSVSRIIVWHLYYLGFPFLLIFFAIVGNFIDKYSGLSRGWQTLFVAGPLVIALWGYAFVLYRFKQKQKIWLQHHGYKVHAKYLYAIPIYCGIFTSYPLGVYQKILVESFIEGKKRWFWSDSFRDSNGSMVHNILKEGLVLKNGFTNCIPGKRIEKYLRKHPEVLEVYISPNNKHVYWVDITVLKHSRLGIDFSNS